MKQAGFRVALILIMFSMAVSSAFPAESPIDKGSVMVGGGGAFSSLSGKLYEDGGDAAVGESREGQRLASEPRLGVGVAEGARREQLDGHLAVEVDVVGAPNLAQPLASCCGTNWTGRG